MTNDSSPNASYNWELVPVDTSQQVLAVPDDRSVIVGRQVSCDLVLVDQYVSRQHASLEVRDGSLFLKDLDSTQGTFVNEERITEVQIKHGDNVRFEKHHFTVRQLDFDATEKEAIQQDSQATIIRKVPEFESTATVAKSSSPPLDSVANEPVASPVAESAKREQKDSSSDSVDVRQSGAAAVADPPKTPEPEKPEVEEAPEEVKGDDSVKSNKGEWWVPQEEGPKGTTMFKLDPDAVVSSSPKVDIIADGPMLVAISGGCKGQEYRLEPGKLILGKGDTANVLIDDGTVSDWHAQIIGEGKTWKVVDLISSNGTFVNGKKIRTAFLSHDDVIRMGDVELQYINSLADGAAISQKGESKILRWGIAVALLAAVAAMGVFVLSYFGVI